MGDKEKRYYDKVKKRPEFKKKRKAINKANYAKNKISDNQRCKEYYENNSDKINKRRKENREKAFILIGDVCLICGTKKHLIFHEIHGKPHSRYDGSYYLKNYKDFITMCYPHHRIIHELMKLDKEQIKLILSYIT